MHKIAFVFRTAPHGRTSGREGLDALLATSALCDELAVFFVEDGLYQLLPAQTPAQVLSRDHAPSFKLLPLYDIEQVYFCQDSLSARGLGADSLLIPGQPLVAVALAAILAQYPVRLIF